MWVGPSGQEVYWPDAPRSIIIREDGRVERICEHGVGHPIGHVKKWEKWMGVHGCDGCCSKWSEVGEDVC